MTQAKPAKDPADVPIPSNNIDPSQPYTVWIGFTTYHYNVTGQANSRFGHRSDWRFCNIDPCQASQASAD